MKLRWAWVLVLTSCSCSAPTEKDGRHAYPRAFADISANDRTCAVRLDGTITCWGDGGMALEPIRTDASAGRFTKVRQDGKCVYALRDDSVLMTFGADCTRAPAGKCTAFAVASSACAIGVDELLRCWSTRAMTYCVGTVDPARCTSVAAAPAYEPFLGEHFRAVSTNGATCAIRTDGEMRCSGPVTALSGKWRDVSVGTDFACALADTGAVRCWSDPPAPELDAPAATFRAIAASTHGHDACGVDGAGAVRCWGTGFRWMSWTYAPPAGRFDDVSVGAGYACARATSGDAECWGKNQQGQINGHPPSMLFRN